MSTTVQPRLPFSDDPVPEIPLPRTPLIVVVAQVQFPAVASITREEFMGPFQERIRSRYPVLRQEREVGVLVTPQGVAPSTAATPVWRFHDKTNDWRVSLAPEFVALDTNAYVSRADFLSRLGEVLHALADVVGPATFDRLGIRYVDRLPLQEPDGLKELAQLVRPEICGLATADLGTANLLHSLTDAEFAIGDDAVLHARWGVLPPKILLEPLHRESVDVPSWLLDLDMYTTASADFEEQSVLHRVERFSQSIYRFFRWAVTDKLLADAGGAL